MSDTTRPRLANGAIGTRPRFVADERVRFAPTPILLGFAFGFGALLAAVLPTRQKYADFADDQPPDAYSIAYLRVLTRANPSDEHLRIIYVRHLQKLGRLGEALSALGPAPPSARSLEAESLRLDLSLAIARAIPEGDPARTSAFERAAAQLGVVAELEPSPARLTALASLALELDRPALAAGLYRRAAEKDESHRPELLAKAARWLRATGDLPQAAQLYEQAAEGEKDRRAAREYSLAVVDTLESDDRACDAAAAAQVTADAFPDDVQVLERATQLAERCDRPAAAQALGRRLLALAPDDLARVEQQAHRELAAGDVEAALPLILRLVEHRPGDAALRALEAHVAEWSHRPEVALDAWLWLLDHRAAQGSEAPPSGLPVDPDAVPESESP